MYSSKKLIAFLILLLLIFPFSSSYSQNKIALTEGEKFKLFEFDASMEKYEQVWESIDIREKTMGEWTFSEPIIIDFDKDGKNELIAMDEFGLFIWGKHGKYPEYYYFQEAFNPNCFYQLIIANVDEDSSYEIITQGPYIVDNKELNIDNRKITIWKIIDDSLERLSSITIPFSRSWSIRWGDCDGDGIGEFVTSSHLINILGYEKSKGLYEKAILPNAAGVVDVVRLADIDNDGINEIFASGNSGCFTIYKSKKVKDKTIYPVVFQSKPPQNRRFSQGLHIGDITGDGYDNILIGLTRNYSRKNEKEDNVLVYENKSVIKKGSHSLLKYYFEKIFSMPLESSGIPGYVIGDSDNDGINEVIYNNKYVLKFSKDENASITCTISDTISDRISWVGGSVIGNFNPEGQDIPHHQSRIIPIGLEFDLKKDQLFKAGETYKCWVKIQSSWGNISNLKVKLESNNDKIKFKKSEITINELSSGDIRENKKDPFIFFVDEIDSIETFQLDIILESESGYRLKQTHRYAYGAQNRFVIFTINP